MTWWHVYEGPSITEALHLATRSALSDPNPDAVLNIESHFYNTELIADRCDINLDLGKEVWLNKSRWSRLTREYISAEHLDRFKSQIDEIESGSARQGATANMMFRDPPRYDKKHRWGGCLMGAAYRGGPKDEASTLTFFSRTTYMGYMGMLDAGIAALIGMSVQNEYDRDVEFRWHISSMQLHCFKTIPFILSQPDLFEELKSYAFVVRNTKDQWSIPPTWVNIAKWYNKILEAYEDHGPKMLDHEKYGPFKRIKRRWLEFMGHVDTPQPPPLQIRDLDFSKCQ